MATTFTPTTNAEVLSIIESLGYTPNNPEDGKFDWQDNFRSFEVAIQPNNSVTILITYKASKRVAGANTDVSETRRWIDALDNEYK
jgi:hypothetical protein